MALDKHRVLSTLTGENGDGNVHWTSAPFTCFQTLCGFCDIMENDALVPTDRKVNCVACREIVAHVRRLK